MPGFPRLNGPSEPGVVFVALPPLLNPALSFRFGFESEVCIVFGVIDSPNVAEWDEKQKFMRFFKLDTRNEEGKKCKLEK